MDAVAAQDRLEERRQRAIMPLGDGLPENQFRDRDGRIWEEPLAFSPTPGRYSKTLRNAKATEGARLALLTALAGPNGKA